MIEKGRVCIKTCGRDAGKICTVVEKRDNVYVIIDGETRRRKCNMDHLEPLNETVNVTKDDNKDSLQSKLPNWNIKKTNPKQVSEKPKKQRKSLNKKTKTK